MKNKYQLMFKNFKEIPSQLEMLKYLHKACKTSKKAGELINISESGFWRLAHGRSGRTAEESDQDGLGSLKVYKAVLAAYCELKSDMFKEKEIVKNKLK